MIPRYGFILPLVAVCLALTIAPSLAARTKLSGTGLTEHVVPLGYRLAQKAFICFKLPTGGNCPNNPDGSLTSPKYVFDNTPDACTSYNTFPGSGGPIDMTRPLGFAGNTTMWVEGACASPVGVEGPEEPPQLELAGARPNPGLGGLEVWFTLASA